MSSAVALAIQKFLGHDIDDVKVLNQSADASIDAGVSLTGAFDDSEPVILGGLWLQTIFRGSS